MVKSEITSALAVPATPPQFVGRERELEELEAYLEEARRGHGGVVFLEGTSGGGKSRLLKEFSESVAWSDCRIFRGQATDRQFSRPFEVLLGVIEDMLLYANQDENYLDHLRSDLSEGYRATLGSVFPEIRDEFVNDATALGPNEFGEQRTLLALSQLAFSLGTERVPAVIILDDFQWADSVAVRFVQDWNARTQKSDSHTLLVLAFRGEEIDRHHPLRGSIGRRHIHLHPLSNASLEQVLRSIDENLPSDVVSFLSDASNGNPFVATSALRGIIEGEEPHLVHELSEGDRSGTAVLIQTTKFLHRRLQFLALKDLSYLKVAALLGKRFDSALASTVIGLSPEESKPILEVATHRYFLEQREVHQFEFVHDKVREAVLELIGHAEKLRLHYEIAITLSELCPDEHYSIALHFHEAGNSKEAFPFALQAAADAQKRHALEVAEQYFRIALKGLDSNEFVDRLSLRTLTPDERTKLPSSEISIDRTSEDQRNTFNVYSGLGEVLMFRGEYDDSEFFFRRALSFALNPLSSALLERKLGELMLKKGKPAQAIPALERALSILNTGVPRTRASLLVQLIKAISIQALHTALPWLFLKRKKRLPNEQERLTAQVYNRLSYAYWFGRGPLETLWAHLQAVNFAESFLPCLEVIHAYSSHGPAMTVLGLHKRALRYTDRAVALQRSFEDRWTHGQAKNFHGVTRYALSRYRDCLDSCGDAVRILQEVGDLWERAIAQENIALALYRLGRFGEAEALSREGFRESSELGDVQAVAVFLQVWALTAREKVPALNTVENYISIARENDFQAHIQLLHTKGLLELSKNEYEQAYQSLEEGWQVLFDRFGSQEWVQPVIPWCVTALRFLIQSGKNESIEPAITKRWKIKLRWALLAAQIHQNNRPHALREAAYHAAHYGKDGKARKLLHSSLKLAETHGAQFEYLWSAFAYGEIGDKFQWQDSDKFKLFVHEQLTEREYSYSSKYFQPSNLLG